MSAEGRLGPGGAASLFAELFDQGRTGVLELEVAGVPRRFVLREGEIVYVASEEKREKLPVRLLARGLVSREALLAAAKAGPDLRAELARSGALAEEAHDHEVRALVGEAVRAVFTATEGSWTFVDRPDLELPGQLPGNPMVPLLWQASRAVTDDFARGFLGDPGQRLRRVGADEELSQVPGLTREELSVVSRIDGYGSVADAVAKAPLPAEHVRRLLVGLTCLDIVEPVGRPGVHLPKPGRSAGARPRSRHLLASATPSAAASPAAAAAAAPAAASASAEPPAAEEPSLERARELAGRAGRLDHYALLGVARDAGDEQLRRAYYALARSYHPDRFDKGLPPADRALVEGLFSRLSEAFTTLSNRERRRQYDEDLTSGHLAREKEAEEVDPRALAAESHRKGAALLASGDRQRGLRFLEHAVDLEGESVDYRLALARAYLADARTRRRAEAHLLEAARIAPARVETYYRLGQLYKSGGLKNRALEQFQKGLAWEPDHAGIREEMANLEPGGDDDSSGGGLLGGLFGRKKS